MQPKIYLLLYWFLLFSQGIFGQTVVAKTELKTAADCKQAVPLTITKTTKYGPTQALEGYGDLQEITTNDKSSKTSFAQEHNSAWYLVTVKIDGQLEFEVAPTDTTNDYDFLLYMYSDTNFCTNLLQQKIKPIRGNLSNNSSGKKSGRTGLKFDAIQQYHVEGQGDAFSASVNVRKDQKYMLVLDNVTPKGKGHTLYFYFVKKVSINGSVLDEDNKAIEADINLADLQGKTVASTRSDGAGKYKLDATLNENENYSLTFFNDSSFISSRTINTADSKTISELSDLRVVLPKLKKGLKYPLGNINFMPGIAVLLSESYPSVEALYRLMAKNKTMSILIEGHVNAPKSNPATDRETYPGEFQELSDNRAETVRDYLASKGIATIRMKTVGMGARQMLYPHARTEAEQKANRRVEIKVISINGE